MCNFFYRKYSHIFKYYRNPDGARNYTFLQSQVSVKRMRQSRRPPNPDTIEELAIILNNTAYASTLQHPPLGRIGLIIIFLKKIF